MIILTISIIVFTIYIIVYRAKINTYVKPLSQIIMYNGFILNPKISLNIMIIIVVGKLESSKSGIKKQ